MLSTPCQVPCIKDTTMNTTPQVQPLPLWSFLSGRWWTVDTWTHEQMCRRSSSNSFQQRNVGPWLTNLLEEIEGEWALGGFPQRSDIYAWGLNDETELVQRTRLELQPEASRGKGRRITGNSKGPVRLKHREQASEERDERRQGTRTSCACGSRERVILFWEK